MNAAELSRRRLAHVSRRASKEGQEEGPQVNGRREGQGQGASRARRRSRRHRHRLPREGHGVPARRGEPGLRAAIGLRAGEHDGSRSHRECLSSLCARARKARGRGRRQLIFLGESSQQLERRDPGELMADEDEDEDIEMEDVEDVEDGVDGVEGEDDGDSASSSSSSVEVDEDDEDDVDEAADLELRRKIEEALRVNGISAATGESDDESEEDLMDDDQMLAIDSQLAAAFKARAAEKRGGKGKWFAVVVPPLSSLSSPSVRYHMRRVAHIWLERRRRRAEGGDALQEPRARPARHLRQEAADEPAHSPPPPAPRRADRRDRPRREAALRQGHGHPAEPDR